MKKFGGKIYIAAFAVVIISVFLSGCSSEFEREETNNLLSAEWQKADMRSYGVYFEIPEGYSNRGDSGFYSIQKEGRVLFTFDLIDSYLLVKEPTDPVVDWEYFLSNYPPETLQMDDIYINWNEYHHIKDTFENNTMINGIPFFLETNYGKVYLEHGSDGEFRYYFRAHAFIQNGLNYIAITFPIDIAGTELENLSSDEALDILRSDQLPVAINDQKKLYTEILNRIIIDDKFAELSGVALKKGIIYNSQLEQHEFVNDDFEIIYQSKDDVEKLDGIWIYNNTTKSHTQLISIDSQQDITASVAPNGLMILYSKIENLNSKVSSESSIYLYNLKTRKSKQLVDLPDNSFLKGVVYWDDPSQKVYYEVSTNIEDLQFSNSATSDFYEYNFTTGNVTKIASTVNFPDSNSNEIKLLGPSLDGIFLYFSQTQEDSRLLAIWKLNRHTLQLENIYNLNDTEFNLPYVLDFETNRDMVMAYGDSEKDGLPYILKLDLLNGSINSYLSTPYKLIHPQGFIQNKNLIFFPGDLYAFNGARSVIVYDLDSMVKRKELSVYKDPTGISYFSEPNKVLLNVSTRFQHTGLSLLNLEDGTTEEVEKVEFKNASFKALYYKNGEQ